MADESRVDDIIFTMEQLIGAYYETKEFVREVQQAPETDSIPLHLLHLLAELELTKTQVVRYQNERDNTIRNSHEEGSRRTTAFAEYIDPVEHQIAVAHAQDDVIANIVKRTLLEEKIEELKSSRRGRNIAKLLDAIYEKANTFLQNLVGDDEAYYHEKGKLWNTIQTLLLLKMRN